MSWRWRVERGCEAAVEAHLRPALERGEPPAGATLVKRSVARETWRAEVPGLGPVYVKRDRTRGLLERWKFLLLSSRSRQEHAGLVLLEDAGIAATPPVASAERRALGLLAESVLVTRAVEGAATLREALASSAADPSTPEALPAPRARRELLEAAARLLRALHERRLFHRDYHAGNILVRPGGALALVDVQKMRSLPSLPPAARARDLAVFLHDLADVLDDDARRAIFAAYGADDALRARVARSVDRRRAERIASRARRCVLRSSGFRIEERPGLRIYRRADVPLEGVLEAVAGHRRAIAAGPSAEGVVKIDPPATCITRRPPLAAEGPGAAPVAVKEFPARGLLHSLQTLFRRHRGLEAWMAAHALLVRGIETPLPLALVEERSLGLVRGSLVLTRWVAPSEDAHLYADRRFAQGRSEAPPGNARGPWGEGGPRAPLGASGEAEAVRALARFVARLHAEGVYHGDLKLPNFLVVEGAAGAPPSLSLLDLDAVRAVGRGVSRRRRAKNLAQIEDYARYSLPQVKRTHRARFLREYERTFPDARALVALVRAHVAFREARRARVKARLAARGERFHDR